MLQHCVFLNFKDEVTESDKQYMMSALAALKSECAGMIDMRYGRNLDLEGKSTDYDYGFIITFETRAALDAYSNNKKHQAVGAQLVANCNGGHDGIIVFDLET